ncbi:hypothetical protein F7734_10880 [Scytonema sp. UIC 10036]|nr:hypothetical protein [Scytonema sp. UIC 10036]
MLAYETYAVGFIRDKLCVIISIPILSTEVGMSGIASNTSTNLNQLLNLMMVQ